MRNTLAAFLGLLIYVGLLGLVFTYVFPVHFQYHFLLLNRLERQHPIILHFKNIIRPRVSCGADITFLLIRNLLAKSECGIRSSFSCHGVIQQWFPDVAGEFLHGILMGRMAVIILPGEYCSLYWSDLCVFRIISHCHYQDTDYLNLAVRTKTKLPHCLISKNWSKKGIDDPSR